MLENENLEYPINKLLSVLYDDLVTSKKNGENISEEMLKEILERLSLIEARLNELESIKFTETSLNDFINEIE